MSDTITPEILDAALKDVADVLTVYAKTPAKAVSVPHYDDEVKRQAILDAFQKSVVTSRSDAATSANKANTPLNAAIRTAIRFQMQVQGPNITLRY